MIDSGDRGFWGPLLLVGTGGFLGSCARFLVGGWAQRLSGTLALPVGSLAANLLGCLAIGALSAVALRWADHPRLLLFAMAGFLGGFTTYSAFAHESWALLRQGEARAALLHLALHVVGGLAALAAGHALARWTVGGPPPPG